MYKIYYNDKLFFQDTTPAEQYRLVDPVLKLASNSAGSLEFRIPVANIMYNELQRMRGLIKVHKNDKLIWEGRITSEDTDFWKNKDIYCEGILACFNDTRQIQKVYKDMTLRQYVESILSIHNQKVDDTKKFNIGIVTVNNNSDIGTRTTNYESTWEIFNGLVQEFGGYLIVRYENDGRYLDYRSDYPRTSTQKIEFGVNLMDFTQSYDMSSLATVLLPLGKTIASAGENTVGDLVDSRLAGGHYISEEDYDIYYDPNLLTSYSASNTFFPVESGKTYYITCRNHGGRIMWVLKDSSGNLVDYHAASSGDGMTDLVESKLEVPQSDVGNYYLLAIAGFGVDIQPRVNASISADEAFDTYTTVESANNGSLYVTNEDAITNYGWIEKQITWSNITDPQELKNVAEKYLKEGQFDEMTLDLTAVDMQLAGIDIDSIDILDQVQVVSKPHGLNKVFPVTELTVKMTNLSGNQFRLGYKTEQTLTGIVSGYNDEIYAKLNALPSQSATLASAKDNATQLINTATSGIFSLEYDEHGNTTGARLSNVADWNSEGAKGWRFTMGGIGYFGEGYDKDVTIAITGEDGGIVANCITAGQMLATRIRGGILGLGHWQMEDGSFMDGELQLADSNGNIIVNMNKDGAFVRGILESTGPDAGGGPETVHIENGWIYGSDMNAGHLSVDTMIEGQKGVSIDTNVMAICVFNRLYTARNSDISDLVGTVEDVENVRFMGMNGYDILLSVKNGFITELEYEYAGRYDGEITVEDKHIVVSNGLITDVYYD